jgi:hypothetical protein
MQPASALLAAYDAQVRTALATRQPDGVTGLKSPPSTLAW